jgi:hypothetical protein
MRSVAVPGRSLVQPIPDVEAPRLGEFVVVDQIDVSPKRHDGQPCCMKVSDEASNFVLIHHCHGDLCYSCAFPSNQYGLRFVHRSLMNEKSRGMCSEVWAVAASMLQLRMSSDQFLWLRVNDNELGQDVEAISKRYGTRVIEGSPRQLDDNCMLMINHGAVFKACIKSLD